MKLDTWQEKVLETSGNICLRSGRQVGKSTIIAIKAGEFAMNHKNKSVMVIASVERQAQLLFEKILSYIHGKDAKARKNKHKYLKGGKDRPTKHKLNLKNGSTIHCLPTGESGYGIRGFTIDLLIADEAAFISEDVWTAVTPMLTVTKGDIWLLSTPHGREGFYYRCFQDEKYTAFHVSSEDCPRKDQDFLDHERKWMTKAQYAQEYLGEFVDKLRQFFPDELIRKRMIAQKGSFVKGHDYYLGVDVARMGEDESTFEIIRRVSDKRLIHVENIITKHTLTTHTTQRVLKLNKTYDFKQIFVDDGGMGVSVFDGLLTDHATRRKTLAINNTSRPLDKDKKKNKKVTREDIYNNLLRLMERDEIDLLDDEEVFLSLKSVQFEYDNGKLKIFGNYTHVAEGLIRAAWCSKDKPLNISIHYI